jgi:hypothetical protein
VLRMSIAIMATLAVAAFGASGALAEDEQPQPAPIPTPEGEQNPWPAKEADIFFYVETLTASPNESVFGKNAPTGCTQTNFFARGERIVWHIAAINAKTGKIITNKQVKYAYLKIPGMKNLGITFTPHGRDPVTAPWTWTGRWDVPPTYPLGIVKYELVMKLKGWKKNKVAKWTQVPLAPELLTILDNRKFYP